MTAPTKANLKIYQGSTFREVFRWESYTKVYVPITGISKTAPVVITTAGHIIPVGWRTKITGVLGMKEINNSEEYVIVTAADSTTVTINEINATGYTTYTSGGVLEYNQPNSLASKTARMQIRPKIDSTTIIKELTTENGGILLDDTYKTITIQISATDTAEFTFKTAVYNLEIVNGTEVTQLLTGNISLGLEVTR